MAENLYDSIEWAVYFYWAICVFDFWTLHIETSPKNIYFLSLDSMVKILMQQEWFTMKIIASH